MNWVGSRAAKPAKRTLDATQFILTLSGSGRQGIARLPPSPSGGEDFPALGRG